MTEADIIDLRQLVVGMNPATRLLIDDKERGEQTHMVMGFWKRGLVFMNVIET